MLLPEVQGHPCKAPDRHWPACFSTKLRHLSWGTLCPFRHLSWGTLCPFRHLSWGTLCPFRHVSWGTLCPFRHLSWGTLCPFRHGPRPKPGTGLICIVRKGINEQDFKRIVPHNFLFAHSTPSTDMVKSNKQLR